MTENRLAALYPTYADYVRAMSKAANTSLRNGYTIEADRDAYVASAKQADVSR